MSEQARDDNPKADGEQRRQISPGAIALLRETREAVSDGRTLPDSTPLIRRMREERSAHLAKL